MAVTGLANLAIKVSDLEGACAWYEAAGATVTEPVAWENGRRADVQLGVLSITLFTKAIYEDATTLPDEGFLHPALFVDDLDAELGRHEVLWGPTDGEWDLRHPTDRFRGGARWHPPRVHGADRRAPGLTGPGSLAPCRTDLRPKATAPAGLAAGLPYAYAAETTDRPLLVFTAGACPLDGAEGPWWRRGTWWPRPRLPWRISHAALESAGARLEDVVKITVYVASNERSDLAAAWRVVHQRFGSHEPPATLLGVSVLGYPDQLFEVEAVAALPG